MKQVTIHKKNEFIRGVDDYTLATKRAMNVIYWSYQKHDLYKHKQIAIRFVTLKKMMNLENDGRYVEVIKNALTELQSPIELNNFYHPVLKKEYSWYSTSFIIGAGFTKDSDGHWVAEIEVSDLIRHTMQKEGNFTMLELVPYLNKFRTKYAMKIYEYLKSFEDFKYIDISHSHMMKLLSIDKNSKYKYYSQLEVLVVRQLNDIAKKSDLINVKLLKSKILAKDKIYRIVVNPKSNREIAKLEAETALDNLMNKDIKIMKSF